jgi:hypothetical protein
MLQRDKVNKKKVQAEQDLFLFAMKNKISMNPPMVGISVYDSKPFNMLTTAGYNFEKELGGKKKVLKLDIIHNYNRYMNG